MKRIHIIITVLVFLIIVGCISYFYYFNKNNKLEKQQNYYGYSLRPKVINKVQKDTFTLVLIDSMITSDKLPILDKWQQTTVKEEETNSYFIYYTIFDKKTSTMYSLKNLAQKQLIIVQKRKISL